MFKRFAMRSQGGDDDWAQMLGRYILRSHLDYARPSFPGVREKNSKIQIVCEDNTGIVPRPLHNFCIGSVRGTDR